MSKKEAGVTDGQDVNGDGKKAEAKPQDRRRFPDRFTVDPPNLERIRQLLVQLKKAVPGCTATRKDVLNWIIEKGPDELNAADLQELASRFYDEERFLKVALQEIREARSRGESRTLDEILAKRAQTGIQTPRKGRKRRTDPSVNSSLEESAVLDDPMANEQ